MAATLEVIGERWTILIVRDIFLGVRRFDDLQRSLGVARNILQTRLERLVEHGIVRKKAYQDHPVRYEYRLTTKGADLWPVLMALLKWGDKYAIDGERPVIVEHRGCGGSSTTAAAASVAVPTCRSPRRRRFAPAPGAHRRRRPFRPERA